jgi:hypothetical protein
MRLRQVVSLSSFFSGVPKSWAPGGETAKQGYFPYQWTAFVHGNYPAEIISSRLPLILAHHHADNSLNV